MKLTIALFLLSCFSYVHAEAQTAVTDTVSSSAASVLVQNYKTERGNELLLYNGVEYARPYPHTVGNPFLVSDTFTSGSLVYDGVAYQNVPLNYDIVSNCVVIKNKNNFLIELIPGKLNSFILNQRVFVSLSTDDIPSDAMPPGIYEWYDDNTAGVFIRNRKVITRAPVTTDPDRFSVYNEIYVQKGIGIFRIKSNKDLLNVFADQKNAVDSYIRQNQLSYKKHPEETAIRATAYYAQLTQLKNR